jgi:hypothetical protein
MRLDLWKIPHTTATKEIIHVIEVILGTTGYGNT